MIYIYTTGDGKPYAAEDGTLLVVGTSSINDFGLITDRTAFDVEEVQRLAKAIKAGTATADEVQKYLNEINKGAYTYRDLNRVEDAMLYVARQLMECGYLNFEPLTQFWSIEDKPTEADWARYFGNIATIRNAIAVWESTPPAPSGVVGFGVNEANALEQILLDVDQILSHIKDAWSFSGDLYSAEV